MKHKVDYNIQANIYDIYTGFVEKPPLTKKARTTVNNMGFKPITQVPSIYSKHFI